MTEPRHESCPAASPWIGRLRRTAPVCVAISLLVSVLGLGAWRCGWFRPGEDPRVVEIGGMMREMLAKERQRRERPGFFTAVERAADIAAVGLKVGALPEPLRPRVMPLAWGVMLDHLEDRMDAYFTLRTVEERRKFIDGEIAQMEFMKKAFSARGAEGGGQGAAVGRGPPLAPGRDARSPDSRAGLTGEQRFVKWVLDRTTPDQRARLTEYIAVFERRLKETGRKAR